MEGFEPSPGSCIRRSPGMPPWLYQTELHVHDVKKGDHGRRHVHAGHQGEYAAAVGCTTCPVTRTAVVAPVGSLLHTDSTLDARGQLSPARVTPFAVRPLAEAFGGRLERCLELLSPGFPGSLSPSIRPLRKEVRFPPRDPSKSLARAGLTSRRPGSRAGSAPSR